MCSRANNTGEKLREKIIWLREFSIIFIEWKKAYGHNAFSHKCTPHTENIFVFNSIGYRKTFHANILLLLFSFVWSFLILHANVHPIKKINRYFCHSLKCILFFLSVFIALRWLLRQFIWQLDSQPIIEVSSLHRYAIGQYVDGSGDVISHLNITHVRTDDGGLYKCIAMNSMGSVEHAARLNVYGKSIILYVYYYICYQT